MSAPRIAKARRVLSPLGVSFPVVFVFDAPVCADVLSELFWAIRERIKAGDEVSHADGVLEPSTDGFLTGACDADDGLGKRQTNGFGLHRYDPDLVTG